MTKPVFAYFLLLCICEHQIKFKRSSWSVNLTGMSPTEDRLSRETAICKVADEVRFKKSTMCQTKTQTSLGTFPVTVHMKTDDVLLPSYYKNVKNFLVMFNWHSVHVDYNN